MKDKPLQDNDVGVIIARFQVKELTEAHIELIQTVLDRHEKVLLFLGVAPLQSNREDPLDYVSRAQMIDSEFPALHWPNLTVLPIPDISDDEIWSINLDKNIKLLTGPLSTVTLYGGTDSFIRCYKGKYSTQELIPDEPLEHTGTPSRELVGKSVINSPDFRAGVIWAAYNKYPQAYPTVDIAVLDRAKERVLLGRKEIGGWRFLGGFVEPGSTLEENAIRETLEETRYGIGISRPPQLIGSFVIDDWRYKKGRDKIITSFFTVDYLHGHAKPGDDIKYVQWFTFKELTSTHYDLQIFPEHRILVNALIKYLKLTEVIDEPAISD